MEPLIKLSKGVTKAFFLTSRYNANLRDARKFGVKKTTASGGGMGMIYFIIFACYALAFWYGSKLVREEEHYTAGVMLTVR